jgi:hypothetical protein
MKMAKVTCLKDVTIGSMNMAFVEGKEYDIPAKDAKAIFMLPIVTSFKHVTFAIFISSITTGGWSFPLHPPADLASSY